MTINERFSQIINTLYGGNKSAFAAAIGITPSVVDNIVGKRQGKPSFDVIEKVSAIAEISIPWLITGEGELLKQAVKSIPGFFEKKSEKINTKVIDNTKDNREGIPLIPVHAMAGFLTGEMSVNEADCERLYIPGLKADFVIPVSGDSMEPRYFSGDLVACQYVALSDCFFQWGKVYVIDTNQGILIKRVRKDPNTNNGVVLISENSDYDPIKIPISDIHHIALVKGLVRIE